MDYLLIFKYAGVIQRKSFSSHKVLAQYIRQHSLVDYTMWFHGNQYIIAGKERLFLNDLIYIIKQFGLTVISTTDYLNYQNSKR